MTEIVPKCKDFARDSLYQTARERVGKQVKAMESVRAQLMQEYESYHKIRILNSSEIFNEFKQSFRDPGHSILMIDFRAAEAFISGHVKWVRHPSSMLGGVVHIAPDMIGSRCV